jgi:hypothetical protein
MNLPSLAILPAALALLSYQAYVTRLLRRSGILAGRQLYAQLALIWLLPLVGAVVCHWFFRFHGTYEKPHELGYRAGGTYEDMQKSEVFKDPAD